MCWQPSKSKSFQVKSFYKHLSANGAGFFPWKNIWMAKVPPRVAFFSWTTALGKILTADNLQCCGIIFFFLINKYFIEKEKEQVQWEYTKQKKRFENLKGTSIKHLRYRMDKFLLTR